MGLKVAIALPLVGRLVQPEWAISLANIQFPMNCNHATISVKGPNRGENRTRLVEAAIQFGCEYLLFLDDDTAPPPDVVCKLIKVLDSDPEAMVCGGIYTSKGTKPYEPMVFMGEGTGPFWRWKFGDVFPCFALGTGCMMIRVSVFETLPKPWFWDIQDKQEAIDSNPTLLLSTPKEPIGFHMTDDIYFCHKLKQHGFKVLAHGGVLPIHYDAIMGPAVLDLTDFPVRNIPGRDVWYNTVLPADYYSSHYQENTGDSLPDGWLSLTEAARLTKEVEDCKVLEFGSYKGRSAVAMAGSARQIFCVDTYEGDSATGAIDTLGTFLTNTEPYANIIPIIANTGHLEDIFADAAFDVVFIDADHSFNGASADMRLAKKFGKRILVHDWNNFDLNAAAKAEGLTPLWVEETLAELVKV